MRKPNHQAPALDLPVMPARKAQQMPAPIPSDMLFRNMREITISHEGSIYRMRITRQGKLILCK